MCGLAGEGTGLMHAWQGVLERGREDKGKGRGGLCLDSLPWKYGRRGPQGRGQGAGMDVGKTGTGQIRTD